MPCDAWSGLVTAAVSAGAFSAILLGSRLITPLLSSTYRALDQESGAQGYWDSSVASTLNGIFNSCFALREFLRQPSLLTSTETFFVQTPTTCILSCVFLTWCVFDLCSLLWHFNTSAWRDGRHAQLVHHCSAIIAWVLYLQGGYGHNFSLVGCICEATNPFMNIRYFLSATGLKRSSLYLVNGAAFCLVWLLARILFAIPMAAFLIGRQWHDLATLPAWRLGLFLAFCCTGACLNLMWGYKLFAGAIKLLTATEAEKSK